MIISPIIKKPPKEEANASVSLDQAAPFIASDLMAFSSLYFSLFWLFGIVNATADTLKDNASTLVENVTEVISPSASIKVKSYSPLGRLSKIRSSDSSLGHE